MGPGLGLQEELLLPTSGCHPFSPVPPHQWAEGGLFLLHCGFGAHSLPFPLLPSQGQVPTIPSSPSLPSSSSVFWSLSLSQTLSTPFRYRPDPLQHTLSLPIHFITFPPLNGCSSGTAAPPVSSLPPHAASLLHSVGMLPWQEGWEGRTQWWINFSHRGGGLAGRQAFLQHPSNLSCKQAVALCQERLCAW